MRSSLRGGLDWTRAASVAIANRDSLRRGPLPHLLGVHIRDDQADFFSRIHLDTRLTHLEWRLGAAVVLQWIGGEPKLLHGREREPQDAAGHFEIVPELQLVHGAYRRYQSSQYGKSRGAIGRTEFLAPDPEHIPFEHRARRHRMN